MIRADQINHLELYGFSATILLLPNKTSTQIMPIGSQDNPDTMPWKVVLVISNMFMVMPNLSMVSLYMMLMLLPSSISTLENFTLISGPMNVGSKTRA